MDSESGTSRTAASHHSRATKVLAAGRAALQYNYSLGITAWLDPLAVLMFCGAYKMLADHKELTSQIAAFPRGAGEKTHRPNSATVQKTGNNIRMSLIFT